MVVLTQLGREEGRGAGRAQEDAPLAPAERVPRYARFLDDPPTQRPVVVASDAPRLELVGLGDPPDVSDLTPTHHRHRALEEPGDQPVLDEGGAGDPDPHDVGVEGMLLVGPRCGRPSGRRSPAGPPEGLGEPMTRVSPSLEPHHEEQHVGGRRPCGLEEGGSASRGPRRPRLSSSGPPRPRRTRTPRCSRPGRARTVATARVVAARERGDETERMASRRSPGRW